MGKELPEDHKISESSLPMSLPGLFGQQRCDSSRITQVRILDLIINY